MQLQPGQRWQSVVCDAQVVIVRAPAGEVEIGCGGAPMVEVGADVPGDAVLDASLGEGPQIGKRYADEEVGVELLCSKAGTGALTVDGRPVAVKGAKPLPASD